MQRAQRLWAVLGRSPAYLKVQSHSRNPSLDISVEEQRLQNLVATLRRWVFALGVLCTLCLLALATNVALQHTSLPASKSPLPRFPSKSVTFEADKLYQSTATTESDRAWSSLIPPGNGFVHVDNPDAFDMKPGMSSSLEGSKEMYNIAAFHQLHCLTSMREYFWHLKFVVGTNSSEQIRPILLDPEEDNILACFDYLRQSIMCSGDTTLEWPREELDNQRSTIDGWGVSHRCIDWEALLEYAQQHNYDATQA